MRPRDELHSVIRELGDDGAAQMLHRLIDTLDEAVIPDVLARMNCVRKQLHDEAVTIEHPQHQTRPA